MNPITYIATCRTEGCENQDLPIEVLADENVPLVFCGACVDEVGHNRQITDLVPVE